MGRSCMCVCVLKGQIKVSDTVATLIIYLYHITELPGIMGFMAKFDFDFSNFLPLSTNYILIFPVFRPY
jgi:hypothetical protein